MKNFSLAALTGILSISALSSTQAQPSASSTATGTAFAVADGFTYVTNYHVIDGARTVCLKSADGAFVRAQVLAFDKADDLALLRAERRSPPLPLASPTEIQRGMPVLTIGFPHPSIMGFESKVTDGIVNSLTGLGGDRRRFQVSAPIQPGNSGGPLLSERGNVLGVVVSKLGMRFAEISGDIANSVGYAIHAARLRALMDTTPELRGVTGPPLSIRPKEKVLLVSQVEKSVALVLATTDKDDCATNLGPAPRAEAIVPRASPPAPAGPSAQERRRQLELERAQIQEEERRRKEAAAAEDRALEDRRRREAAQTRIVGELQLIAANWRDAPGSLGLALWRQSAPPGAARLVAPDNLTDDDIGALRQLRDFLQTATGLQFAAGATLPLSAAELTSRGVVRACGRVERVFREAGYFIFQTLGSSTLTAGYVETDRGWRLFAVEKRLAGRLSSLIPQGAKHVNVGSEVLATRCD